MKTKLLYLTLFLVTTQFPWVAKGQRLDCGLEYCYNPNNGKCENSMGLHGMNTPGDDGDPFHISFMDKIVKSKMGQCSVLTDVLVVYPQLSFYDLRGSSFKGFLMGGYARIKAQLEGASLNGILWSFPMSYAELQGSIDKFTDYSGVSVCKTYNDEVFCGPMGTPTFPSDREYEETKRRQRLGLPIH